MRTEDWENSLLSAFEARQSDRDTSKVHISTITSCPRKQGYEILGTAMPLKDIESKMIFEAGHALHHAMQALCMEMGWIADDGVSGTEVPVESAEHRVIGSADAVTVPLIHQDGSMRPGEGGERYVLEFKTCTNRPYLWLLNTEGKFVALQQEMRNKKLQVSLDRFGENDGRNISLHVMTPNGPECHSIGRMAQTAGKFDRLTEPSKAHYTQANIYAHLLGITRWAVIYINKDAAQSKAFKVFSGTVNHRAAQMALKKADEVYDHTDRGLLPGRPYDRPEEECRFCQQRTQCW